MTAQQIFTTVATHLLTQKVQALATNPETGVAGCMYRTPDGKKCAVGCLIPDDRYDSAMETKRVETIIRRFNFPLYFQRNLGLLEELQEIHDERTPAFWKYHLRILAKNYGFGFPEGV